MTCYIIGYVIDNIYYVPGIGVYRFSHLTLHPERFPGFSNSIPQLNDFRTGMAAVVGVKYVKHTVHSALY